MIKMPILIVVGGSGSGKTTVSRLVEENGYRRFEAGQYADVICRESERSNLNFFLDVENRLLVAKSIQAQIEKGRDTDIVISGFRIVEEIKYFKLNHQNVSVIGVYASEALCYSRTINREGREKFSTLKEFFFKRECEDYALGLGEIYSKYLDFEINNDNNDLNRLREEVRKILKKVERK